MGAKTLRIFYYRRVTTWTIVTLNVGHFFLSFKEMTKIWGKNLQSCLRIVRECHSLIMKHMKLLSTLVLEGMCRLCIILRCQMLKKTLLWKSQFINNLFSHHICYMYLKYVQYLFKETRALSNGIECMLEGLGTSKTVWALFFFLFKKIKRKKWWCSLQLNEFMSTGCTNAL